MMMPGRKYEPVSGSGYRYSINGQEKEKEIADNITTALYWEYDSRIGRRWNSDPKPNISISPYVVFENNPIWFRDILGDSIVDPNRTKAYSVFLVGKNRDKTSDMSAKRVEKTAEKNPTNAIYIESDKLDQATADEIIKRLGSDGYVGTLVLDYHRGDYDEKMPEKDKFYSTLANGYAGQPTQVLAGMCWAGGGVTVKEKPHPDLTMGISQALDKATVYGLKTQASNLPFRLWGDYGVISPDYYFSGKVSKSEREYRSTWTISSYDTQLKKYDFKIVKERIILNWSGIIQIK